MSQTCRNKSGNTTSGGNISKLGASCCDEEYWLEACGEIEEIPGVIWMLKAISSCLMLAMFGRLGCAFPSLLTRLSSRHLLVSLPRLSGVYPPRPGAQTVDTNEIAASFGPCWFLNNDIIQLKYASAEPGR